MIPDVFSLRKLTWPSFLLVFKVANILIQSGEYLHTNWQISSYKEANILIQSGEYLHTKWRISSYKVANILIQIA